MRPEYPQYGNGRAEWMDYLKDTRDKEQEYMGFDPEPDSDGDEGIPYDVQNIRIDQKMITVFQIEYWISRDVLNLTPEYQRNLVWDVYRKSALIESLLLHIPISVFYLDEDRNGAKYVIDGTQRLSTIHEFLNDGFPLKRMQYLKGCEQKKFSQLAMKYKSCIEDTVLTINILDARCPQIIKFDVFRRVNTGGIPLNPQEIRNVMATPGVRTLLKEMSECAEFLAATRGKINDIRMGAQELCLRYLAIYGSYDWNKGTLDDFHGLLRTMDAMVLKLNKLPPAGLENILKEFRHVMRQCEMVLGKLSFCKYESNTINKAIFTSWSVVLANLKLSDAMLAERASVIRAYYLLIHLKERSRFYELVSASTGSRQSIIGSIKTIRECCEV